MPESYVLTFFKGGLFILEKNISISISKMLST